MFKEHGDGRGSASKDTGKDIQSEELCQIRVHLQTHYKVDNGLESRTGLKYA